MPKNIGHFFIGILAVAIFCVACADPAKKKEKLSAKLLDVSGIHLIYAEGIVAGYRNATARKKSKNEINCFVTKITPELVLPALTSAYATEFSDEELNQAITFFESETGNDYVRYQRVRTRRMFGVITTEKMPEFSPLDENLINAFAETRFGKLYLTQNSPMSESAKVTLRPQLIGLIDQCSEQFSRKSTERN